MIQLHPDYLIFQTSQGDLIPCSAESVTIELIGEAASILDPDVVREAAAAVVHYFKNELNRETVSIVEFSKALERVLNCFGYEVTTQTSGQPQETVRASESNLADLAAESSGDFELGFFRRLRDEFKRQLETSPEVLRFVGLKECVKHLVGAKRWCQRCERLSDQIVDFLRECLIIEAGPLSPGLLVR